MPKEPTLSWRRTLEERYLPDLTIAAMSASNNVRYVEFDFINSQFRVVVENRPTPTERDAIHQAIEAKGRDLAPHISEWPVWVRRPHPYPFTLHLGTMPQEPKAFQEEHHLTVFQIEYDQLLALRGAEAKLSVMAGRADYVVAFALGGTAAMIHIAGSLWDRQKPRRLPDVPPALDQFARKYHLFPGLQWNLETKAMFSNWFASLPTNSTILIFDTGTKGNGPREIANTIRDASVNCKDLPRRISIIGIVDGTDRAQRQVDEKITASSGARMCLTIDYLRVPRVLSEDCQILMGYDRNREFAHMQPLKDNALIRIVDDSGRALQIIGASSAASTFHDLMTNSPASQPPAGGKRLTKLREEMIAATILEYGRQGERAELHNAWAWGLLTDREFQAESKRMIQRYKRAIEDYDGRRWNFIGKEVRHRKRGEK